MSGFEFIFIFGVIIGFLIGLWFGGRWVLIRMHHDDVENAHLSYRKRKDKYLGRKD
jgi:hypothetical protein